MSPDEKVLRWVEELRAGQPDAARKLWDHYYRRVLDLARKKLRHTPRREADEEDVALSALKSFCLGVAADEFPELLDEDHIWRLLAVITRGKADDLVQRLCRQKRGGGKVRGESALAALAPPGEGAGIDQVVGHDATPDSAALVAEECRRLLDGLGDDELRVVALWKMEGYTNAEIATMLGCSPKTVERKLKVIRSAWVAEVVA